MTTATPHPSGARLFVAVAPSAAACEHLRAAIRATGLDGLRPTPDEQWHVTLAFAPSVRVADVAAVSTSLSAAVRGVPALRLRLRGAGRFGDRVLWVGVGGDVAALAGVAAVSRAALAAAGALVEDRPFHPHLTVARGSGPDRTAVRDAVGRLDGHEGPSWPVDEVRLVRSHPGESGARHEVLAICPLATPSASDARFG